MTSQSPQLDARAEYKKRVQQRQTVIFGSITAVLAVLLLVGTLVWTGLLPFPFNKEFSRPSAEDSAPIPCPVEGMGPAALDTITVRVYNSSATSGLAGEVGSSLATLGVVVSETSNWGGEALPESARIYAGTEGVTSAYTLRAYFPGSTIHFDATNNSEVVDVVLGEGWVDMNVAPTQEDVDAAMQPIEGCSAAS